MPEATKRIAAILLLLAITEPEHREGVLKEAIAGMAISERVLLAAVVLESDAAKDRPPEIPVLGASLVGLLTDVVGELQGSQLSTLN